MHTKDFYEKRRLRARKIAARLKKDITTSEFKFRKILDEIDVNYKFQKKIFTKDGFYIADFYLPKSKIIIEIDGGIHIDRFEKDKNRELEILKTGKIRFLVRFDNEMIGNVALIKGTLDDILNKRGEFYEGLVKRKSDLLNKVGLDKNRAKANRSKDDINELACWQAHKDWRYARLISFKELHFSDENIKKILNGDKITQGNWVFNPMYKEKL